MTVKEAPFSLHDLIEATTDSTVGWRIGEGEIQYRCVRCDALFPQDSNGWAAMRAHEFEHGRASRYEPDELDGKLLRVHCLRSVGMFGRPEFNTYGIDEANGVVYHLNNQYAPADYSQGGWKWKLTNQTKHGDGPKDTLHVQALLSNGSANTDAK